MLMHICRRCGFQTQVFEKFVNHLWEQEHQKVSRSSFLKWSNEDNLRSLVLYAPTSPYPLPSDVVSLFVRQSIMVVDFVCWTDRPQNFVIQFSLEEDVVRMMELFQQQSPELTFGGTLLGLRKKCDVGDFEWPGLIGDGTARNGSSENAILIELSDDSNSNDSSGDSMGTGNSGKENNKTTNGSTPMNSIETDNNDSVEKEDDTIASYDKTETLMIETRISDEFRDAFLEKMKTKKRKTVDDKKSVERNLRLLVSKWLEIFVGFHNKLWPLCFAASNKEMEMNRNEVGFEAKFIAEFFKTKFSSWLADMKKKKEIKIVDEISTEFLKILSDDKEANERLIRIKKQEVKTESEVEKKGRRILKFKVQIVVTFSDSGTAIARTKFHGIKGENTKLKMKAIERLFKKLFRKYELLEMHNWSPVEDEKIVLKKEKEETGENSWSPIILVELE